MAPELVTTMLTRRHIFKYILRKLEGPPKMGVPGEQEARNILNIPPTVLTAHIFEVNEKTGVSWKPYKTSPPRKKDERKYRVFHEEIGHETADCHKLKDQIEDLRRRGCLTEFVAQEVMR